MTVGHHNGGVPPTIERLGADDVDAIHDLWRRAGLHVRPSGRDSAAHITAEVDAGTATLLGIRGADGLIGVVLATHDGRKGWINRLAVDPDQRRRGLGSALIAAAEEALAAAGIELVAALVEGDNRSSRAMFEAAGYATGDIVYFRKPLGDPDW